MVGIISYKLTNLKMKVEMKKLALYLMVAI